jgi:predicted Zn-dependent peptidase
VIAARLTTLREGLAVTYGMSASYTPRLGPGEWRISGQLDAARAVEGFNTLQLALDELRGDPEVWKGDFVLARRQAVDELLVSVTSPSVVASQLSFVAAFDLPLDFREQLVEQLAAVRPADLQRIIEAELAADSEVIGLFGPPQPVHALEAALAR